MQKSWLRAYLKSPIGMIALILAVTIALIGIYAPLFAGSKPLIARYDGQWYFPLFRYLFYKGYYTKAIDLFYNLLMFTLPFFLVTFAFKKRWRLFYFGALFCVQMALFIFLSLHPRSDPASFPGQDQPATWEEKITQMPPFSRMSLLLLEHNLQQSDQRLQKYAGLYAKRLEQKWKTRAIRNYRLKEGIDSEQLWKALPEKERKAITTLPTLYYLRQQREKEEMARCLLALQKIGLDAKTKQEATQKLAFLQKRREWIGQELKQLHHVVMPLIRPHHWEEDIGGGQDLNLVVPWWELARINHRDLVASLLYGVRVSLMVGVMAVALSLLIALPIGALSGYFAGKCDLVACRLMEIWESMPTFFMLLLVVAITASKSVFLVIGLLALFSWTQKARLLRAEVLKQRNLPYVEAGKALGLSPVKILMHEILPNALPPIVTLLPFAMLSAMTAEAGLSFLGLGEEGSCSLGVLMDEGRSVFPGESYLLWPPALFLTVLLICIAIIGDTLRDAIDPKLH